MIKKIRKYRCMLIWALQCWDLPIINILFSQIRSHSHRTTRSTKSFPPFLLEIFISSNSRNLLQFLQRVTVQCKGERRKTWQKSTPPSLWFKKSNRNLKPGELSRLCPETSKKWYIHEFGFCTCWSISSSSLLLRWATIPEPIASPRTLIAVLNLNNTKLCELTDQ